MSETGRLKQRCRELEALAESAENDCQRAIAEKLKLQHDLRCLEESTVDLKAWNQSQARISELHDALEVLYKETADYIVINNLGDVHHNQSMRKAACVLGINCDE